MTVAEGIQFFICPVGDGGMESINLRIFPVGDGEKESNCISFRDQANPFGLIDKTTPQKDVTANFFKSLPLNQVSYVDRSNSA